MRVYVTSAAQDSIRVAMAAATLAYWCRLRDTHVTLLDAGAGRSLHRVLGPLGLVRGEDYESIRLDAETSQRDRHHVAHADAQRHGAPWYLQADDDILPRPEFNPRQAVDIATRYDGFGMIALLLPNCPLPHAVDGREWRPQHPVEECASAGGVRLMRSAMEWELPPFQAQREGRGYDVPLALAIRAAGWKVGFFTEQSPPALRGTHMGEHLSLVWRCEEIPDEFPRYP